MLAVGAALASLAACAEPAAPTSGVMRLGSPTLAPRGYLQFCNRRPDQCGLKSPVAAFDTAILQRALAREEWTNVMSVRQGADTPAPGDAPATAPEATVFAPVSGLDDTGVVRFWAEPDAPALPDFAVEPLLSVGGGASETAPEPAQPVPVADAAPALEALFRSVKRDPAQTLVASPALLAHLERVNADINARIRPRTDVEAFGVDDYWTLPLDVGGRGEGNCKHYALEKRRALVDAGVSEDALSIAIVRTPRGETHAVLLVATDRGELVMDNLTPELLPWRLAGYVWLSRQTPGEPLRWASLAGEAQAGM